MAGSQSGPVQIPDNIIDQLYDTVTESSFRSSGAGSFNAMWQAVLSRVDRFGYNPMPPNHEVAGLTFITRPKLNLTTANLQQDRLMSTLATVDPVSFPFSIRCYLDTRFASRGGIAQLAQNSPFFNSDLPFIVPLTNCLQTISGFPDLTIDVETTEGGFYGEDQSFAKGSDMNMKSTDFSLQFRDIQGGYIMSLFVYWVYYIAMVSRGSMLAYLDDIINRRLNYTCSIYRFILDPSRRYVTKWAKATGCFPKSLPIGNVFNINERESYLHAASQFTVPFQVNDVKYMDPIIFRDFNYIVDKFAGNNWRNGRSAAPVIAANNFTGIPYMNMQDTGLNELQFWAKPEELQDPYQSIIDNIMQSVNVN